MGRCSDEGLLAKVKGVSKFGPHAQARASKLMFFLGIKSFLVDLVTSILRGIFKIFREKHSHIDVVLERV